jgi:peroxiredoxin
MQAQNAQGANDIGTLQSLQKQYNETMEDRQMAIKQFALDNPSSIAGAFFVNQDLSSMDNAGMLDSIYRGFDSSIYSSLYVQKIKQTLDIARQTSIGQPAPELTLNDVSGKSVSLSSFKGKYVLLDFWASWCGPCREENPNVVNAYNKYKNKGFTVLGVSLDENRAAWQNAIKKDGLTWVHVSDLQGWKSSAAANYGVQAIPANFLLDKEGVIIARDLRQELLESKLNEVLND